MSAVIARKLLAVESLVFHPNGPTCRLNSIEHQAHEVAAGRGELDFESPIHRPRLRISIADERQDGFPAVEEERIDRVTLQHHGDLEGQSAVLGITNEFTPESELRVGGPAASLDHIDDPDETNVAVSDLDVIDRDEGEAADHGAHSSTGAKGREVAS
jgi:hypothetical protein